jgi:hypothetical protein
MLLRRASTLAASVVTLGGFLALPIQAQPLIDWIDSNALAAGEVAIRTGKGPRNTVTIDVAIVINAQPEVIWDILTACEIAPDYVPNIVACESIDSIDNGASELFIQTVKPAFFIPKFEHVFRLDYFPPQRIEVHRVSGPIAEMDGYWWLLEQENMTVILMHSLTLRPGIPVPRPFVRSTLRRDLPIVLRAVRDRAQSISSR